MNVAIIPARGGSRRIPRKNIRMFHGKPIIAYSIDAAKASGLFGEIVVSSDDREILHVSESLGATPLMRHESLACDGVGTQEVARAALGYLDYKRKRFEFACCIYATAPMLTPEDLRMGFAMLPGFPYAYVPGLYYWGKPEAFLSGVPLSAGVEVPFPAGRYIDINEEYDWQRAERMYAELHGIAA